MEQLSLTIKDRLLIRKNQILRISCLVIFIIASLSIQAQIDVAGEVNLTKKNIDNSVEPDAAALFTDADFKLYPNPASDVVNIQSKVKLNEGVVITLCDIRGNILEKRVLGSFVTKSDYSFNLGKYTGGQYIIGILAIDGSRVTKKLIKRG